MYSWHQMPEESEELSWQKLLEVGPLWFWGKRATMLECLPRVYEVCRVQQLAALHLQELVLKELNMPEELQGRNLPREGPWKLNTYFSFAVPLVPSDQIQHRASQQSTNI